MPLLIPGLENPHTHLREGEVLPHLVRLAVEGGARTLGPMPNTSKGLMNATAVTGYLESAQVSVPAGVPVRFIGIVQITENTTKEDIDACVEAGVRDAKVYPKGRTTESHNGVEHYARILDIVRYAGKRGMRIHFHPEHPLSLLDNRDAEFLFLPIVDMFFHETNAVIVWEHATDSRCIPFFEEWAKSGRLFVTITAHHLVESESGTYGDVQAVCKPSYKKEVDRRGLIALVEKNYPWVMAGGDDAPHSVESKHRLGPCACGAYTAPFLLPLYAHGLRHLLPYERGRRTFINFTSRNAHKLYGHHGGGYIRLVRKPFMIPPRYTVGPWTVEPFWAGREISYSLT